ncbi:hypothetical protein CQA53_00060 [Helicobacter didelphidarum]|uniref:DUF475 domain-containing protein n=1 Tax=Helicobacter didelphidarum TaxID=2040648 RepID=A0A3D8IQT0_9HELI|nr:DUF475 domain-containing protein [Helicobacter didelphidarum]RDU67463.1 hypothetical protein CQA53_00060 [Helicobacter didelphidarum]
MKYFYSSFVVTLIGLGIAYYIDTWEAVYICVILSLLEISLSFDNAVVNAKVLNTMEEKWQQRFIYWGIPIAVFGMRFVFPILIVAIAARMGILETLHLAIYKPDEYHKALETTRFEIYAFGGAFLLMVFLQFFFSDEKDEHWISLLEANPIMRMLVKFPNVSFMIAITFGIILLAITKEYVIGMAYFSALALYLLIHSADTLFGSDGIRNGLMGFLYLEVLDASFSFDGVIGAFALSENIFIIMVGLGIGAMFVRSLTLYFVKRQVLQKLIYLEHGAHYAIGALAVIMIVKIFTEVSEIITGLVGVGFIGVSFICSIMTKKKP